MRALQTSTLLILTLLLVTTLPAVAAPSQAHGYSPKYPANFTHFDYVNANAPKSGSLNLSVVGSFDTLNPYILKGLSADYLGDLLFETLMTPSLDEPFSQYGLLAEDAQVAADGLSVTYTLRPEARFSDGTPVTADDVVFSFNTLKSEHAHPRYRYYWTDITSAESLGPRKVRFHFAKVNPELHMIAGQIPIFPRHWVGKHKFEDMDTVVPIGSGPYVVESYDFGKQLTYKRNPDYWARDLAVRRGMYNFDRITLKYYRDSTVALEGFKAGEFDFILENNSKKWARDYNGPQFSSGRISKRELPHHNNAGIQGFAFNLRRPLFEDRRVREAIGLAMDFEWDNRKLFYNQYTRCDSYFSNSELAARALPSQAELKLLEPFREQLPAEVFTQVYEPPTTNPPSSLRKNLRKAKALLESAGWHYRDGALRNAKGEPFKFDVMLASRAFERIMAPFARNLAILGIEMDYRTVDIALYQRRTDNFDFDMVVTSIPESQSPGNELKGVFTSAAADINGSNNIMGIKSPVVDALVNDIIYAKNREALVTAAHALDRVLLWGHYMVPNWYIAVHRIAYWNKFAYPTTLPLYYEATSWFISTAWSKP